MPQADDTAVAVQLMQIQGALDTGFATLNGRLDSALQRAEQTEKDLQQSEQRLRTDLAAVETRTGTELSKLDTRVGTLEKARWPLPSLAALVGLGGLAVSLWSLLGR
ncbi:hypothetical protein B0E38_06460 [Streptomyces sp. 111WW2]|uniref:hypothetical protein n=1 Tax=Streptomyces sp. 111WW2 TaxID=1945515 RepID=UPI000D0C8E63|nr:hypothetical protein [Streptomyces sp. 111WW2]PSK47983.1 hypothetical protein B0E38_06460 [Streptomyces sp. 111WW2]